MSDRFRQLAQAIEQARMLELDAPRVAAEPWATPWMPFNLFDFAALLFESIPMIGDEGRFLDVGAGPGSKMVIARDAYGLDVHGIELLDPLAQAGRDAGLDIKTLDAGAWTGYSEFDVIWLNRPYRDANLEQLLERRIWDCMAPGAVIICANLESRPPQHWFIVSDQWEDLRRGSWAKPYSNPSDEQADVDRSLCG